MTRNEAIKNYVDACRAAADYMHGDKELYAERMRTAHMQFEEMARLADSVSVLMHGRGAAYAHRSTS
ncbi:hypothetical protein [Dactylosporangium sp. CA-139066]|uniref:hypothetical protein n=1 Tax=Dactylosporangium sp. CA-139066 TaxID=3239930 RepID=UPI003D8D7263